MNPDLGMLRGLAVQEDAGTHKLVKLFAVHQLSCEPTARFKAVFQERAQWSWQDLQPYVEDLQVFTAAQSSPTGSAGRGCAALRTAWAVVSELACWCRAEGHRTQCAC